MAEVADYLAVGILIPEFFQFLAAQAEQHLLGALRAQSENPALDAQNIEFCTDALPREADAFDELTEEKSNAERNDEV